MFPTTGLLDNFNRADSGTLGANWTNKVGAGDAAGLKIVSNHAEVVTAGSTNGAYWSVGTVGPDSEAYVTLASVPTGGGHAEVFARLVNAGGTFSGYGIDMSGSGLMALYRWDAGANTQLGSGYGPVTLTAGDAIGIECAGLWISSYYYTSGTWSQGDSSGDTTYPAAGHIGLRIQTNAATTFDDFSGGTMAYVPVAGTDAIATKGSARSYG